MRMRARHLDSLEIQKIRKEIGWKKVGTLVLGFSRFVNRDKPDDGKLKFPDKKEVHKEGDMILLS